MIYSKEFKTYKEQIELLERRGIKFNIITKEEAEKIISNVNYYKLSGYIKIFEIDTDNYNIEFSKIIELYKFDRKLASYIFGMIEKIEVAFKTKLIYFILERTRKLGAFGYLETSEWKNYTVLNNKTKKFEVKKTNDILKDKLEFKKRILEFIIRDTKNYVERYFEKYNKEHFIPLWMLGEIIDFGMATKMYDESVKDIKKKVAKELGNFMYQDLSFYLRSIKLIRNTIAHNGSLWNFRFVSRIDKPLLKKYPFINDKSFIAVLVVIVELLKNIDESLKYDELHSLIRTFFKDNSELIEQFGIMNKDISEIDKILKLE